MDLEPECFPFACNKKNYIMGRSNKKMFYKILVFKFCRRGSFSAPSLVFVGRDWNPFDKPLIGKQNNHVLLLNHIFDVYLFNFIRNYICCSFSAVFFTYFCCFFFNKSINLFFMCKKILAVINKSHNFCEFIKYFLCFQACNFLKSHIKNCLGLFFRKIKSLYK